jgi:hypothetical protein
MRDLSKSPTVIPIQAVRQATVDPMDSVSPHYYYYYCYYHIIAVLLLLLLLLIKVEYSILNENEGTTKCRFDL